MPRKVLGVGGSGVTFSSGGTTINTIPKEDGAGGLKDSALVDNGTTVTSSEPIISPAGTASLPAIGVGGTTTGIFAGSGQIIFTQSATATMGIIGSSINAIALGQFGFSSNTNPGTAADAIITRKGAANLRFGAVDLNGTPVDQTLSVQNAITGSDLPGGHFTLDAPLGTGLGAASKISINRAIMKATGATAQTSSNAFAVGQTKTLSNTSATAQTIATITLGSNAGGGCSGIFTIVSTDGTNFDSETQSFNVSFVNKATVVTVGTPAITASTAAVNSGTTSLGITAVASGNDIAIKVTPVFGTIVPTTVTLWPIITHSTGTVTFS